MTGLECQIENCYHRNQPEDATPLKFAEIVRVVKRPGGKRTYAEGCFWPPRAGLKIGAFDDKAELRTLELNATKKSSD